MDDFRRRYDVPRRNYGMPSDKPVDTTPQTPSETPPQAASAPAHHPQPPHAPHHPTPQPSHQPAHHSTPARIDNLRPPTQRYTPAEPYHQTAAQPQPSAFSKLSRQKYFKFAIAGIILVILLIAYLVLKPAPKAKEVLPADLAKQAGFSVYYPSSTPGGFIYDKNLATFTDNQAYFLLNKGTEHVIVREQSWSSSKLDTSSITDAQDLPTPVGKAAIGTNSGQTAAVVLAKNTLINITSNGSVPHDEMIAIINNLKNISPK